MIVDRRGTMVDNIEIRKLVPPQIFVPVAANSVHSADGRPSSDLIEAGIRQEDNSARFFASGNGAIRT